MKSLILNPKIWVVGVAFLLLTSTFAKVIAVPLNPEVQDALQQQGMLEEMLQLQFDARQRGLEAPTDHPFKLRNQNPMDDRDIFRAIVILIDFSDNQANLHRYPPSHFDDLIFSRNTFPTGSLSDYYVEVSYNGVEFQGEITTVYYRMPHTYAYYTNRNSGLGAYPRNAQKMVEDAVDLADPDIDFSIYDNNGDGFVEGLFVVHAGSGAESPPWWYIGGVRNLIWSHKWIMVNPRHVDGVTISQYLTCPDNGNIGVYCHETGHLVFSLVDLYDTTPPNHADSEGLGNWSLMAGGSWLDGGKRPAHPDAYSRIRADFTTPNIITVNSLNVSLPAVESGQAIKRLWTDGSAGSEYYLVENRQSIGFDDHLPSDGLLVYHVDETQLNAYNNNNPWYPGHTTSGNYLVALEQADGDWDLEQNHNSGDDGDPWPGNAENRNFNNTSTPNSQSYASQNTAVSILNISDSQTTMTADLLVQSQPGGTEFWTARYNGPANYDDWANSLAVDGSRNVYVTGWSWGSANNCDYATIKYNSAGVQQWAARYDGPANSTDQANSLAVDGSGNVYVTGWSWGSANNCDYATIKYNSAGVQQWAARYDGPANSADQANSLAVDGSGNVYVTGYSVGSGTLWDYATIKYNSAGVQQWVARYNGPSNSDDLASSLAVDGSGNIYVTGESYGSGTLWDYATIKYNSAGVQQWVARYNGPGNNSDGASSLAVDGNGNAYVTGFSFGNVTDIDYATIKYNSAGVQQWVARYNGPSNSDDLASSLAVDGSGNAYVTGSSGGNGVIPDYATIKYNSAGVQQWVARYNGPGNVDDEANDLAVDGSGNVYVTGYSYGSGTSYDYTTIKYNSAGVEQWVARYNGLGNNNDEAYSLAVDGSGNVYVTGYSTGNGTGEDYTTIKYSGGNLAGWDPVKATVLGAPLPSEYLLEQNFPNPFNPTTTISYQLPANSHVKLEVFDISGRLVTTLSNGMREAGSHEVTFDGSGLAAGVYVYRLQAGDYTGVEKMVLLK